MLFSLIIICLILSLIFSDVNFNYYELHINENDKILFTSLKFHISHEFSVDNLPDDFYFSNVVSAYVCINGHFLMSCFWFIYLMSINDWKCFIELISINIIGVLWKLKVKTINIILYVKKQVTRWMILKCLFLLLLSINEHTGRMWMHVKRLNRY